MPRRRGASPAREDNHEPRGLHPRGRKRSGDAAALRRASGRPDEPADGPARPRNQPDADSPSCRSSRGQRPRPSKKPNGITYGVPGTKVAELVGPDGTLENAPRDTERSARDGRRDAHVKRRAEKAVMTGAQQKVEAEIRGLALHVGSASGARLHIDTRFGTITEARSVRGGQ